MVEIICNFFKKKQKNSKEYLQDLNFGREQSTSDVY